MDIFIPLKEEIIGVITKVIKYLIAYMVFQIKIEARL